MVTVVDDVVAQEGLGKHRIPESLRQLLEQRLDRLSPDERRLIEVGSIAGAEFAVAAVAFALEIGTEQIEACCEGLTHRGQWLQERGTETWPDGTVTGRYGFIHTLYEEVAYQRMAPARCLRFHRRIGERLEMGYGDQVQERAAELAAHFERGQIYVKAVQYREQAAENAIRRAAYQEAITHLTNGLTLAETLPDAIEHTQSKLRMLILLALAYTASKGQAVPEVERTYMQARVLCEYVHDDYRLFRVLIGLARCYGVRSEYQKGEEIAGVLLQVAQRVQDPRLLLEARMFRANFTLFAGAYLETRYTCEQALANYDRQDHHFYIAQSTIDPGVNILSRLSWALWCLGYPDQALARNREMLTLAQELGHVHSLAMFSNFAALTHQLCGEAQAVTALTHDALQLSTEHGFHQLHVTASIMQGWFLASHCQQESGIIQMQQGLADYTTTGIVLYRLWYLTLLADVYRQRQQSSAGLATLTEAMTISRPFFEPELYRLHGELLLIQSWENQGAAETGFMQALDLARRQQAKSWELRAATSLARLWQSQGKRQEAYELLEPVYGWFTEGFDTADLKDAKALVEALSAG